MSANEKRFETFEEFWPFYVKEHANPWTRRLHFVGTTAAMSIVAVAAITRRPVLLLGAAVAGYGPAWISHFFIEHNRPATFKYPLWSLRADFVMWRKMVLFQMDAEVARVVAEASDAVDDSSTHRGESESPTSRVGEPSSAVN